jgi:hypothetical protein
MPELADPAAPAPAPEEDDLSLLSLHEVWCGWDGGEEEEGKERG